MLRDAFGRSIEYVRLSVTDRCDLRCHYCLPKHFKDFQEPAEWLSFAELTRVMQAFAALGTRRVRITGGEPLTRQHLPELIRDLAAIPGIEDLSLSTNATRLAKNAAALKQAGVSRINVSLDSLQPVRFAQITGGGKLEKVLAGLMAAKAAGFAPIKINMVVMRGVNTAEVADMVNFCIEHDFTLRFIETMPIGNPGRDATDHYVDLREIKSQLETHFDLIPGVMPGGGPARYVRVAGTELRIGFITPMSQHFCDTCNRVRLSADGNIYLCLGQNAVYPLREHLRRGISDAELQEHILHAIALKPARHEFNEHPAHVVRFMAQTGG